METGASHNLLRFLSSVKARLPNLNCGSDFFFFFIDKQQFMFMWLFAFYEMHSLGMRGGVREGEMLGCARCSARVVKVTS